LQHAKRQNLADGRLATMPSENGRDLIFFSIFIQFSIRIRSCDPFFCAQKYWLLVCATRKKLKSYDPRHKLIETVAASQSHTLILRASYILLIFFSSPSVRYCGRRSTFSLSRGTLNDVRVTSVAALRAARNQPISCRLKRGFGDGRTRGRD